MKSDWSEVEQYRVCPKGYHSNPGDHAGIFVVHRGNTHIKIMASDAEFTGWEHVSVSVFYSTTGKKKKMVDRMPTWNEMCFVKDLFWGDEELVAQFHPPKSEYVNLHNHCLHLWKKEGKDFAMPDKSLV